MATSLAVMHGGKARMPAKAKPMQASREQAMPSVFGAPLAVSMNSPCKINAFLRVLRKKDDGQHHDLASLFQVISLYDHLLVQRKPAASASASSSLTCSQPSVPTDQSNLALQAVELFQQQTGIHCPVDIHIDKTVPAGGGLGGGNGNAATVLFALNKMCNSPASNDELLDWAGELGSDTAVFFAGGAAYCTGRGEIVEPIDTPFSSVERITLVKPSNGLSTGQIFASLGLAAGEELHGRDPRELLQQIQSTGMDGALCVNDLESPAFKALPALADIKHRLQETTSSDAVFMSGSGSTMVCWGISTAPDWVVNDANMFHATCSPVSRTIGDWYGGYSEFVPE